MNEALPVKPPSLGARKEELSFRWLGVGGIQLCWRGKTLLIDPFLTRPSLKEVLFCPLHSNAELIQRELPNADALLITHAHYDHLMDVAEIIRQTGAIAYGSNNVINLLRASGVPQQKTRLIRSGDTVWADPFLIQVIPAKHLSIPFFTPKQLPPRVSPPRRVWDYQMDACYSFFLPNTEPSILIWHSVEAKGALPADLLIIDVEIPFPQLERLLRWVNPRWVIPIHWDDFFLPLSSPLKPFFHLPQRNFFRLGRLDLAGYARKVAEMLPQGEVYLPQRLKRIDLTLLTEDV